MSNEDEQGLAHLVGVVLDEVRSVRDDVRAGDARQDERMNALQHSVTEELRRVHDRVDANRSKISRNSQDVATLRERSVAWKRWTTIVGCVVGVAGLAYTLITALSS